MPRPPVQARHLPPKSLTPPPNKRQPKPWCTQYSQDLKEHLAAEKQIAAACADEVVMAAIRADPQILEEHLAIEATVNASRADDAMRLDTLNDSSWRFLEPTLLTVWLISCRVQLTVWFNSANVMFNSSGCNFVLSSM